MRIINTKYPGKCAETLRNIGRNEVALFDPASKKLYCQYSNNYTEFIEAINVKKYIQAQEDAFIDNNWNKCR
jgi:hypothetical protein